MKNAIKDPSQVNRFKEAARELACDESEAAFDEKLKKLAQPQVKDDKVKNPPESE